MSARARRRRHRVDERIETLLAERIAADVDARGRRRFHYRGPLAILLDFNKSDHVIGSKGERGLCGANRCPRRAVVTLAVHVDTLDYTAARLVGMCEAHYSAWQAGDTGLVPRLEAVA